MPAALKVRSMAGRMEQRQGLRGGTQNDERGRQVASLFPDYQRRGPEALCHSVSLWGALEKVFEMSSLIQSEFWKVMCCEQSHLQNGYTIFLTQLFEKYDLCYITFENVFANF